MKNNLNTFRILYIVYGCLFLLGVLAVLGYGALLDFILDEAAKNDPNFNNAPFDPATFFAAFMGVFAVFFGIAAILNFYTATFLKETRNHTFILVVSILNCFSGILGILLGIFTIIEINKPEVKALFKTQEIDTID